MAFVRIAQVLGAIVMAFGMTLLVPLAVSQYYQDGVHTFFAWTVLLALGVGLVLFAWGKKKARGVELQARDGILLVGLVWTLLPLIASLPIWLYFEHVGQPIRFSAAYFEAMSGLTTTGSTVLSGLDNLAPSVNWWRCFLQWLGGMGILVLAVAILPMLGVGGSQLFRAEASGPSKDSKLTPRITETAKGLWAIYAIFSLLCVTAYWWGGMSGFDAWTHMFTTMSLGGLSTHDASFGYFQSPTLEWIAIVFMLLASCNFALYFLALVKRNPRKILQDSEWRATVGLMVGVSIFIAGVLLYKGVMHDPIETLRTSLFNVVSIGSTTGYATTDYTLWPIVAPILMIMLSGVATSAGSTGAGIKMSRLLILLKQTRREMKAVIHPRAVQPVTLGGHAVDNKVIFAVLGFMLMYGATIIALTLVLLLTDMPFDTALTAVVASINNMGPGLNEVGPAGNFGGLSTLQLWVCSLAMLLGRLEILSFLVLFTPGYWRK